MALIETMKEVLFLRQIQAFIMLTMQGHLITIKEDNQGSKMADKFSSRRTRCVDINHNVVRDTADAGKVMVTYVRMGDQHAGVPTKALLQNSFGKQVVLGQGVHCGFHFHTRGRDEYLTLCLKLEKKCFWKRPRGCCIVQNK